MNTIWFAMFAGLVCFIWGFAYYHSALKDDAERGSPIKINGKIYKLVELNCEVRNG
ncbi:hypothetical protein [Acinetobacter guerrae]|uniref:hypothetical protein n=1 Tax=Acinetobacter guerrae TaxID=1843371 RepID=UPI00148F3FC8|nr:hypothetical protein [Acinetobacter guerrae]